MLLNYNAMKKLHFPTTLLFVLITITACSTQVEKDSNEKENAALVVEPNAGKVWNVFGLQIVGKIMSEDTKGEYSVIMSNTPPNGGPPKHVHQNEDELFYVLQGKYEFVCGDEVINAEKGALIHLPKGIPHAFKNIGDTEGILMNTISPGSFEQFFDEVDQLPKDKPIDRDKVKEIAAKYNLSFL